MGGDVCEVNEEVDVPKEDIGDLFYCYLFAETKEEGKGAYDVSGVCRRQPSYTRRRRAKSMGSKTRP